MLRSIDLCVLRDASIELFCVLKDYESGTQDAEVTNSVQISESAVRRSLQFFSLSEKCGMMNICRCQDKGGTFSSVILSHWGLHLHCLVSSPYSAPDSNPPSVAQKFYSQPVYLTSRQLNLFRDLILSWGVRNRVSPKRADISCCSPHRL